MKRNKRECDKCNKEIGLSVFKRHYAVCKGTISTDYGGICPYCGLKIDGNIGVKRNHYRWCEKNPKSKEYRAEARERLASSIKKLDYSLIGKKISQRHSEGVYELAKAKQRETPSFKGKHHSQETKDKIRKATLSNPYQRKCKSTVYYNGFRFDSTWEIRLAKILDELSIKWSKPKPIKWIDNNKIEHNYFADFYLDDYDIYLDPKNDFCMKVQKEKIDYFKKNYSNVFFLCERDLTKEFILSIIEIKY